MSGISLSRAKYLTEDNRLLYIFRFNGVIQAGILDINLLRWIADIQSHHSRY